MPRNPNLAAPMVMRGFDSYRSPVDGAFIQTRKDQSDDLKRHDCVLTADTQPTKGREKSDG